MTQQHALTNTTSVTTVYSELIEDSQKQPKS